MIHANNPRHVQFDSLIVELPSIAGTNGPQAIGAEDDGWRPRFQRQREARTRSPASDDRDDLIAMLPSVAVRTMVNRYAVALLEARNLRQVIANAGGNERHARAHRLLIVEGRFKEIARLHQVGDRHVAWFDSVRAQLLPSKAKQFQRWDTVAAEKAMQCRRTRVPRLSGIAEQHTTTAAREHERGAETSWTSTDNDDVEHAPAELQATGHYEAGVRENGNERFGF
jgi:hypothetical protein